jgi:hypothetical protein
MEFKPMKLAAYFCGCLGLAIAAAPQSSYAALPAGLAQHIRGVQGAVEGPLPSPPAEAEVMLSGHAVTIHYNTPSMRGRKIMGGLVPYGKVWRTGANPATSFTTTVNLKVGNASVPAGSYTLYTLPSEGTWMLIINKQTGQWGTIYDQSRDLVRVEMKKASLAHPQEKMSISFEDTHGSSTELHVRWETTDVSVPISAE